MPGKKNASLKKPDMYEDLREEGALQGEGGPHLQCRGAGRQVEGRRTGR